jgi:hypothetical protein
MLGVGAEIGRRVLVNVAPADPAGYVEPTFLGHPLPDVLL